MWLHHLVNLLGRSWANLVRATSTNTLGFILWTVAITAVSWVATFAARWVQLKREKREHALSEAIHDSWLPAIFEAIAITILVFCLWGIFTGRTTYQDHQSQVSENIRLLTQNKDLTARLKDAQDNAEQRCEQAKGKEVKRLQRQLNAVCFRPDRHLTLEDHAVIFAELQKLAEEYKKKNLVPTIRLICGCQDNEVSRFLNDELWPIFRNAGWTMRVDTPSEKLTAEQITKNCESQRAWIYQAGFAEGITVFDKDSKGFGWGLTMPFYERGYGGMWDQRHAELPNVDGLTIWVGYKSTR